MYKEVSCTVSRKLARVSPESASIILGTTELVAGIRENRDKVQVTTAEQTDQTNKLIKNRVRDVIPVNSPDCGSRRADRARGAQSRPRFEQY